MFTTFDSGASTRNLAGASCGDVAIKLVESFLLYLNEACVSHGDGGMALRYPGGVGRDSGADVTPFVRSKARVTAGQSASPQSSVLDATCPTCSERVPFHLMKAHVLECVQ